MESIRLATEEEVQKVAATSDLSFATSVVTFGGKDFAVLRNCFEVDPIHFHEESKDRRKLLFLMNLETALRLQGVKEFYFNIAADDTATQEVMKSFGAEATSKVPEIRFKKAL